MGDGNNPLCKWISELNSKLMFFLYCPWYMLKRTEMVPLRKSSQILALVPTPWVQLRHLWHKQLLATLGRDNTSTHTNTVNNKNLQNNKTTTVPHHKEKHMYIAIYHKQINKIYIFIHPFLHHSPSNPYPPPWSPPKVSPNFFKWFPTWFYKGVRPRHKEILLLLLWLQDIEDLLESAVDEDQRMGSFREAEYKEGWFCSKRF